MYTGHEVIRLGMNGFENLPPPKRPSTQPVEQPATQPEKRPYAPLVERPPTQPVERQKVGFKGWLVFFAFYLASRCVLFVVQAIALVELSNAFFTYFSLQDGGLSFLVSNIVFCAYGVLLFITTIFLLLKKKRMIRLLNVTALVLLAYHVVQILLYRDSLSSGIILLMGAAIDMGIPVMYFRESERVKNTLVK